MVVFVLGVWLCVYVCVVSVAQYYQNSCPLLFVIIVFLSAFFDFGSKLKIVLNSEENIFQKYFRRANNYPVYIVSF